MKITVNQVLDISLGPAAAAHVRSNGIAAHDIHTVVAAAGGPKGLALIPLDHFLFGEWLQQTPVNLLGASIGAWRMACAAQPNCSAALQRLQDGYLSQRYATKPSPADVADECRTMVHSVFAGHEAAVMHSHHRLHVVTARGTGALAARTSKTAFAQATLANALSRKRLAKHLQRVTFVNQAASLSSTVTHNTFDAFGNQCVALSSENFSDALLASGSIPLICEPVHNIAGAPAGVYWDGGMIDYHPHYPLQALDPSSPQLVLYPHFTAHIVPGWLDKFVPWRKEYVRQSPWLANTIVLSPSPQFLAQLPNGKLPDRNDFYRYGQDHDRRIHDWQCAITQCQSLRDAFAQWVSNPQL